MRPYDILITADGDLAVGPDGDLVGAGIREAVAQEILLEYLQRRGELPWNPALGGPGRDNVTADVNVYLRELRNIALAHPAIDSASVRVDSAFDEDARVFRPVLTCKLIIDPTPITLIA